MEREDNDSKNNRYKECYYAGGSSEYISCLNPDKVREFLHPLVDVNFWKINSLVDYYLQKPLHDVMGFKRELNGIIMDIALQWYVSPFAPTIFDGWCL